MSGGGGTIFWLRNIWIVWIVGNELLGFFFLAVPPNNRTWIEWLGLTSGGRRLSPEIPLKSPTIRPRRMGESLIGWEDFCLVIIADPQITDAYSYKQLELSPLIQSLAEIYSDAYMKRSFRWIVWSGVKQVLFLGDLFDGGREDSAYFQDDLKRFRNIFPDTPGIERFYVAGNHDIGVGSWIRNEAVELWLKYFTSRVAKGGLDYSHGFQVDLGDKMEKTAEVANIAYLIVNSLTLAGNNTSSLFKATGGAVSNLALASNTIDFLNSLEDSDYMADNVNRILFSHIPLYRGPGTDCTNERKQSKSIEQGSGYQITVPTFSWLQGNRFPSFVTVTINECSDVEPGKCLVLDLFRLPSMYLTLYSYAFLFVISVAALALQSFRSNSSQRRSFVRDFWQLARIPLLFYCLVMFLSI